jgi:hypothetical protein
MVLQQAIAQFLKSLDLNDMNFNNSEINYNFKLLQKYRKYRLKLSIFSIPVFCQFIDNIDSIVIDIALPKCGVFGVLFTLHLTQYTRCNDGVKNNLRCKHGVRFDFFYTSVILKNTVRCCLKNSVQCKVFFLHRKKSVEKFYTVFFSVFFSKK